MQIQSITTTNYNIKQNSFKSRQFNFKEYINSPEFKTELKEISENTQNQNKVNGIINDFVSDDELIYKYINTFL